MANIYTQPSYLPMDMEDVEKSARAFLYAVSEMGKNDQNAVIEFLDSLNIKLGIKNDQYSLSIPKFSIWDMRAISKKAIAFNELEIISDKEGLLLAEEEMFTIVEYASTLEQWKKSALPVKAIRIALDEYLKGNEEEEDEGIEEGDPFVEPFLDLMELDLEAAEEEKDCKCPKAHSIKINID